MRGIFVILAAAVCAAALPGAAPEPGQTLRITVRPAATLTVNHAVVGQGESFACELGAHEDALLKLSAPGYRTAYRYVRADPGGRRHEPFELDPEPIPVLFRASAETRILCDGMELGKTPLPTFFDQARTYRIVARAEGFQERTLQLDLRDGKPRVVDLTMVSDSGTLQIASQPTGARVFVGGVERGVTPCTLTRVREGTVQLRLTAEGCQPVSYKVALRAGETVPLDFTLEPLRAGLLVSTVPTGARIYVDGAYRGQSDLHLGDLKPGTYALRAVLDGYAEEQASITLPAGARMSQEFMLRPIFGSLTVQTQPPVTEIWSAGKKLGETVPQSATSFTSAPCRLAMAPGTHTVVLKAPGYADAVREITVTHDRNTDLRVQLEFSPDVEIVTRSGTYRGYLIGQSTEDGSCQVEIKPGFRRTFRREEIERVRYIGR